jgi:hypothetical protein
MDSIYQVVVSENGCRVIGGKEVEAVRPHLMHLAIMVEGFSKRHLMTF